MKENVLITGGNGLVGSAFNGGVKVSSKNCDFTVEWFISNCENSRK